MLRHEVEARYGHALRFAEMQHQLCVRGTYYFRIFPKAGNEEIIRKIAALGHEIGYHYDDLSACKGNYEKAMQRFQKNLAFLRGIAPVRPSRWRERRFRGLIIGSFGERGTE